MKILIALIFGGTIALVAGSAIAADSCTPWMKQPDGSWWRTCVDNGGRQYCETARDGTGAGATRVSCR